MKKIFLIGYIMFICIYNVQAQEYTAEVISSAGNSWQSENMQIEWTIGEMMTESFEEGTSLLITQGIHQGFDVIIKEPPVVETLDSEILTITSAIVGGNITSAGGGLIIDRGVYLGSEPDPVINGQQIQLGTGMGVFTDTLVDLTPGANYYVVAYATNSEGTSYGAELSFCTVALPIVTTTEATEITDVSAIVGGEVSCDGADEVIERGVYWGTQPNPYITGIKLASGVGLGAFSETLENLQPGTLYYFIAYAVNNEGTGFGDELSFTTLTLPIVTTAVAENITESSAMLGGEVISDGGSPVTERGIFIGTEPDPYQNGSLIQLGDGIGLFNDLIENLDPGTTYYFIAYASSIVGTAFGDQISFETLPDEGIPPLLWIDDLVINSETELCLAATEIITVAGNGNEVVVHNGGYLRLSAGVSIRLLDGFRVEPGGGFHGWIDTSGEFCLNYKSLLASGDEQPIQEIPDLVARENNLFFKAFPNPTNGWLTLELAPETAGTAVSVEVYTMLGELIQHLELSGSNRHLLDLSRSPKGIYIIRVLSGERFGIEKVIKK